MRRGLIALATVISLPLLALPAAMPAHAQTLSLTNIHLAATPGTNQPAVTSFPSGTTAIYFDFTVQTPETVTSAAAFIEPVAQGDNGTLNITSDVATAGSYGIPFLDSAGWPDGQYCVTVQIDGVQNDFGAQLPIGLVVGSGSSPNCSPTAARVATFRATQHHHQLFLRWSVADAHGLVGFLVRQGRVALTHLLIPVHRSPTYSWRGRGNDATVSLIGVTPTGRLLPLVTIRP